MEMTKKQTTRIQDHSMANHAQTLKLSKRKNKELKCRNVNDLEGDGKTRLIKWGLDLVLYLII